MEAKHTPGPWVPVNKDGTTYILACGPHRGIVGTALGCCDDGETGTAWENGVLMASAPDLAAENARLREELEGGPMKDCYTHAERDMLQEIDGLKMVRPTFLIEHRAVETVAKWVDHLEAENAALRAAVERLRERLGEP